MSRIQTCFEKLRCQGRKALIPYITAGDPNVETSLGLMHALVASGADIIELGFPFSDPSSDGPVVQRAVERALKKNTSLKDVLNLVARFRETDDNTPVVLMGYLNPVEIMGYQAFTERALAVGVDGVLIVDMPPEESHELWECLVPSGVDTIFLVAPTTRADRAKAICQQSRGYVYYVSLKGVTGAAHLDVDSVAAKFKELQQYTDLPIGVGFGIKDADSAAKIAAIADAVVVGSALVSKVAELEDGPEYSQEELLSKISLIKDMRTAIDGV